MFLLEFLRRRNAPELLLTDFHALQMRMSLSSSTADDVLLFLYPCHKKHAPTFPEDTLSPSPSNHIGVWFLSWKKVHQTPSRMYVVIKRGRSCKIWPTGDPQNKKYRYKGIKSYTLPYQQSRFISGTSVPTPSWLAIPRVILIVIVTIVIVFIIIVWDVVSIVIVIIEICHV